MSKKVLVDAESLRALLDAIDTRDPTALERGIMRLNIWRDRAWFEVVKGKGITNPLDVLREALEGPVAGHCAEGDRCVCGGDAPRVRAGCGNWRTG